MDLPWPFSSPQSPSAPSAAFGAQRSNLPGLEVRRARFQDLAALTDLLTESFHQGHPAWLTALLRLSIQEELRLRLCKTTPEYVCWVAMLPRATQPTDSQSKDTLVGTVELGLRSPFSLGWPFNLGSWLAPQSPYLYIANLAVSPDYRRQGVAKQLLEQCAITAQAWKRNELYLHVLSRNIGAQRLYHSQGFRFRRIDPSLESFLLNHSTRQLWHRPLPYPVNRA